MDSKPRLSIDVQDSGGRTIGHIFSRSAAMNDTLIDLLIDLNELAAIELGYVPFNQDDLEYYYEN